MQELIEHIGRAKAVIDDGMCRVGPRLDPARAMDGWLVGAASRAIGLADAVVQLCRHDHASESLPLLRQLAEIAVAARWLVAGDAARQAEFLSAQAADQRWEDLWSSERLRRRTREAAMPDREAEEILARCRDFIRAASTDLPWSHVFPENQHGGVSADSALVLTVRLMGHVLKALDSRWPGNFAGAEAMWER